MMSTLRLIVFVLESSIMISSAGEIIGGIIMYEMRVLRIITS